MSCNCKHNNIEKIKHLASVFKKDNPDVYIVVYKDKKRYNFCDFETAKKNNFKIIIHLK